MKEVLRTKINQVERLIVEEFMKVPFHNLFMLNNIDNTDFSLGGTCSDKVMGFKKKLLKNNIKTTLHSSIINNQDCHRMLSIIIGNQKYYIDIGSGWPMLKLIPENQSIIFNFCGICFKTEAFDNVVYIYQKTNQRFKKTITIPKASRSENEIIEAISARFRNLSIYPFNNSLRYSILKKEVFYFLKGNNLRIFTQNRVIEKKLNTIEIINFLKSEFQGKLNIERMNIGNNFS